MTEAQLEELKAYCENRIGSQYRGESVAGFGTQYHAMLALIAENERLAARVGEVEDESVMLDRLMESVTDVLRAQDGYRQTQIIGRIQTVAERSKWEAIRQEALDRLLGVATGINHERIKAKRGK